MPIALLTAIGRIQKRKIGVIAAKQPRSAEIERLVAGNDRQVSIERIVRLADERRFVISKDFRDIRRCSLEPGLVARTVPREADGILTYRLKMWREQSRDSSTRAK